MLAFNDLHPAGQLRRFTLNKEALIQAVADHAELSKVDATKAVNAFMSTITTAMSEGQDITLVGFGTFSVKERAARTGRNPQTGKEIAIAAAKIPSFKPGKGLKDSVN